MIISLKKQRKIDTSNLSLTGAIYSLKQNNSVEFESSLERDYINILEYNNDVVEYIEQPIKIEYFEDDVRRTYIPDFWAKYNNGQEEIIEIKYLEELNKNEPQLINKHFQANLFCENNNLTFKVLTEKDIRTPYLENAKFLLYYRTKEKMIENNHINLILNILGKYRCISVIEMVENLSRDKYVQAEYLFTLWYLISINLIGFDQKKTLSMKSIIYQMNING